MMKNIIALAFLLCTLSMAFGQDLSREARRDYESKLKVLLTNHLTEKPYLHFDKPYYAAGDTIYFKAYVTAGDQFLLSKLSEVLHVDLITPANIITKSIKLQLVNGVAWGDFALPDSLPKGNYHIRAYTQWMLNIADANLFEQTIPVGSLKDTIDRSTPVTKKADVDLQFFPEGGEMLAEVNSKIAFKAISADGKGIDVKGVITDNTGKEAAKFIAIHLGMGYFNLTPDAGKTYHAKFTAPDGSKKVVNLPTVNRKGLVLMANNDSLAKIKVQVVANKSYYQENQGKDFSLEIYAGGVKTIVKNRLDHIIMPFDILKKRIPTGIARISLLSAGGEPLSERLVFVQSPDLLTLDVSSDKKEYSKRGKVNISLNAQSKAGVPSTGDFSVSVTDESKVPVDENNESSILTNLLLTADLRGYVEQPGYYFAGSTVSHLPELDVLLLTQGYRRYVWVPGADSTVKYLPEKYLQLSGVAKNSSGKPIENGDVTLIGRDGGPMLKQVTDKNGAFRFGNLVFQDSTAFIIRATYNKGKSINKIILDKDPPAFVINEQSNHPVSEADALMDAYLANALRLKEEMARYGLITGKQLKQVNIKAQSVKPLYRTLSYAGAGGADQVLHMKDVKGLGGQLGDVLNGRLRGVTIMNGTPVSNYGGPMLVVVDGVQSQKGSIKLNDIPPSDVKTVEVLKYANAFVYAEGHNGVIVITTKQGGEDNDHLNTAPGEGMLPVTLNGFHKAREFYTPIYDNAAIKNPRADLRTTIYWKPDLVTDKDGNTTFSFFNADGAGSYRVVVEGIDSKGAIGRQVYRYAVK